MDRQFLVPNLVKQTLGGNFGTKMAGTAGAWQRVCHEADDLDINPARAAFWPSAVISNL